MKKSEERKAFLINKINALETCQLIVRRTQFNYINKTPKKIRDILNTAGIIFSYIIEQKRSGSLLKYAYIINVEELEIKNTWTEKATYVAVEQGDGTLSLRLNFKKVLEAIKKDAEGVEAKFTWLLFHEYRHNIQIKNEIIQSYLNYGYWDKFNELMQKTFNKSKDEIDHIFHEFDPAEVDAHIFACEMTGLKFKGTLFDLTDETIKMLGKPHCTKRVAECICSQPEHKNDSAYCTKCHCYISEQKLEEIKNH